MKKQTSTTETPLALNRVVSGNNWREIKASEMVKYYLDRIEMRKRTMQSGFRFIRFEINTDIEEIRSYLNDYPNLLPPHEIKSLNELQAGL